MFKTGVFYPINQWPEHFCTEQKNLRDATLVLCSPQSLCLQKSLQMIGTSPVHIILTTSQATQKWLEAFRIKAEQAVSLIGGNSFTTQFVVKLVLQLPKLERISRLFPLPAAYMKYSGL